MIWGTQLGCPLLGSTALELPKCHQERKEQAADQQRLPGGVRLQLGWLCTST